MQQPPSMVPMVPSLPPANITTEQIQKYLDENKKLILAILDNQNLGKLAECAQYQAQLQKNLMYLAAIADAQPQTPSVPVQVAPHPAMPQGGFYMQHPQAAAMGQQPGVFSPRMPMQFNNPHQTQEQQQHQHQHQHQQQQLQQHQQAIQAQMGNRSGVPSNGIRPIHSEVASKGGSSGGPPVTSVHNDRNKQDTRDAGPSHADGQGGSAGHIVGEGSEEPK